MKIKVDKPYPEVRVEGKNEYYAELLSQDYAGNVSELTACNLYSYQYFDKFEENKEFADVIEEISIVEMTHLELLGKTIKLLGKEPRFEVCESRKQGCILWNAGYVNYETDLKKMLINDIKGEKTAIKNYELHKRIIEDKYIKEMLDRIILDEKRHVEIFETIYNGLK